ncbi:DUF4089 domain-containing protein [Xylophilus rhododendri]|uniref:DUF4089 domain-containing protein n=1 Tax=Xylophilus rhododendri TaxID=2697032 RepID=A0A857J260_9BURK|nr:AtzG-like protein [Xylophilus rhododendri]QHI98000.1 DUF4089 domain-containing protein [Xylophilus rhododendri]
MSGPLPDKAAQERYVDATAALIGLPLAADHRPGVLGFFALAASMAAAIEAVPLTPHDDSPMRFEPVSPREAA